MLEYHKADNAGCHGALPCGADREASRFRVLITDDNNKITEFEKPANRETTSLPWVSTSSAGRH